MLIAQGAHAHAHCLTRLWSGVCSSCCAYSALTHAHTHTHMHTQEEEEVLYPPLTYLQPISEQTIKREQESAEGGVGAAGGDSGQGVTDHDGIKDIRHRQDRDKGKVIMVKPSFPS
jgi:hypothetical protein